MWWGRFWLACEREGCPGAVGMGPSSPSSAWAVGIWAQNMIEHVKISAQLQHRRICLQSGPSSPSSTWAVRICTQNCIGCVNVAVQLQRLRICQQSIYHRIRSKPWNDVPFEQTRSGFLLIFPTLSILLEPKMYEGVSLTELRSVEHLWLSCGCFVISLSDWIACFRTLREEGWLT